jgi:hypothetical protein
MRAPHVRVVPIQIRPDLAISIGPIPLDLTQAEAEKVARVILAYAQMDETECGRV